MSQPIAPQIKCIMSLVADEDEEFVNVSRNSAELSADLWNQTGVTGRQLYFFSRFFFKLRYASRYH